jgi:hypothetical protein
VLTSNTDAWDAALAAQAAQDVPPARRRPRPARLVLTALAGLALGFVLVLAILLAWAPRPTAPRTLPAAVATVAPTVEAAAADDPTGNAIVQPPCLDVGAADCLVADPRLGAAIALLRGTSRGPALLKTAAEGRVAIRVGTAPPGALAAFRSRARTVTVDARLVRYSPRGLAAILAHELSHVSDWSKVGALFAGNTLSCYSTEASAFRTETAVWDEIAGGTAPADRLEEEVDAMAQGVDLGGPGFWLSLGSDYLDECA